mmetsp:Transcript_23153/g.75319  ORF Transcript_23153/g.75319 Transcript_23153/m.75319 type:complete len:789 (+) Transcript_23153:163-2529(+)
MEEDEAESPHTEDIFQVSSTSSPSEMSEQSEAEHMLTVSFSHHISDFKDHIVPRALQDEVQDALQVDRKRVDVGFDAQALKATVRFHPRRHWSEQTSRELEFELLRLINEDAAAKTHWKMLRYAVRCSPGSPSHTSPIGQQDDDFDAAASPPSPDISRVSSVDHLHGRLTSAQLSHGLAHVHFDQPAEEEQATLSPDISVEEEDEVLSLPSDHEDQTAYAFDLQVVEGRNFPNSQVFGLIPQTFCAVSLLFADKTEEEELELEHGIECQDSLSMNSFQANGPFKIRPQAITRQVRGLFPVWNETHVLVEKRPSFVVVRDDESQRTIMSTVNNSPLDGQNVLLLLSVHERAKFGSPPLLGKCVIEVRPGNPIDDWFPLFKHKHEPVLNTTEDAEAAVRLRIGFQVADVATLSKTVSRRSEDRVSHASAGTNNKNTIAKSSFKHSKLKNGKLSGPLEHSARRFLERIAVNSRNDSKRKSKDESEPDKNEKEAFQSKASSPSHDNATMFAVEMSLISAQNIPQRLTWPKEPSVYCTLSLVMIRKASSGDDGELKLILQQKIGDKNASQGESVRFKHEFCSSVLQNSNPIWNERFVFSKVHHFQQGVYKGCMSLNERMFSKHLALYFMISVYDQFQFGADRVIGHCFVRLRRNRRLDGNFPIFNDVKSDRERELDMASVWVCSKFVHRKKNSILYQNFQRDVSAIVGADFDLSISEDEGAEEEGNMSSRSSIETPRPRVWKDAQPLTISVNPHELRQHNRVSDQFMHSIPLSSRLTPRRAQEKSRVKFIFEG